MKDLQVGFRGLNWGAWLWVGNIGIWMDIEGVGIGTTLEIWRPHTVR